MSASLFRINDGGCTLDRDGWNENASVVDVSIRANIRVKAKAEDKSLIVIVAKIDKMQQMMVWSVDDNVSRRKADG